MSCIVHLIKIEIISDDGRSPSSGSTFYSLSHTLAFLEGARKRAGLPIESIARLSLSRVF